MNQQVDNRNWLTSTALAGAEIVFVYLFFHFWREDAFSIIFATPFFVFALITLWLLFKPSLKPWLDKNGIRISLMTGVVLMFAASGIVWLNAGQRFGDVSYSTGGGTIGIQADHQGWPMPFRIQTTQYPNLAVPSLLLSNLLIDILIGLGLVILVAVACEWLIRRREARKT